MGAWLAGGRTEIMTFSYLEHHMQQREMLMKRQKQIHIPLRCPTKTYFNINSKQLYKISVFKLGCISRWVLTVPVCCILGGGAVLYRITPQLHKGRQDNCSPAVGGCVPLAPSSVISCCATSAQLPWPGDQEEARFFLPTVLIIVKPHPFKH